MSILPAVPGPDRTVPVMTVTLPRRVIAGLLAVATAVAAGVTLSYTLDRGRSADPGAILAALAVCAAGADHETRSGCFDAQFTAAAESRSLATFYEVMGSFEKENPDVLGPCRSGAMEAGRRYGRDSDPVRALATAIGEDMVCSNGFIMGVYEGAATTELAPEDFRAITALCDALPGTAETMVTTEVKTGCVDGYGHAAWLSTRDVGASSRLCMFYDDPASRGLCVGGLFHAMRLAVEPASPVLASERRHDYCDAVRAVTGSEDLVNNCFSGVALGLTMRAAETTRNAMAGLQGAAGLRGVEDSLPVVQQQWAAVLDSCATWGDRADSCHSSVVWELKKIVAMDTELCRRIVEHSPHSRLEDCTQTV